MESNMNGSDVRVVELSNVCKKYENFQLDRINLELNQGEMLGLIGANGAGKSTCLRLMLGFIQPDSGQISVFGQSVNESSIKIKQHAAYVSEDMSLYQEKSLAWHIAWVSKMFEGWDSTYTKHLLGKLRLNPDQKVKEFSLGQRVKAALLLALARKPKLLVLDEPTTGLDPVARYELIEELFQLMLNEENSIVFSSQYTQDVERLSDKIAFINDGKIIDSQNKEEYLDKWKRIFIKNPEELKDTLPFDVLNRPQNEFDCSVIVNNFSTEELQSFIRENKYSPRVENMTLEEIFINQVLSRR